MTSCVFLAVEGRGLEEIEIETTNFLCDRSNMQITSVIVQMRKQIIFE